MNDIFLSYKSEDKPRAKVIAEELERHGYSVWWDQKIPPGKDYDEFIKEKLDSVKCVVVLWSKESVKSKEGKFVRLEATRGDKRGILVPVMIDDVEPPFTFTLTEAAKLIDWDGTSPDPEFDLLLNSVGELVGQPPAPKIEIMRPSTPVSTPTVPKTTFASEVKKKRISELSSEAQSLFDRGLYAEAIVKWQEVLSIDSENRRAIEGREQSKTILKETEEKNDQINKLKAYPKSPAALKDIQTLNRYAQQLFNSGKYDQAIEKWNEILNIDPENQIGLAAIATANNQKINIT